MSKELKNDIQPLLDKITEKIEPIDFARYAYPEIEEIEQKIEQSRDESEQRQLASELKKYTLTEKQKYVIVVEKLIELAEQNNYGLCKNKSFCYLYNGGYWVEIGKDELMEFLGDIAERMGLKRFDARQYVVREQLLKQFFATGFLPAPKENDEVKINLQNGTFYSKGAERGIREYNRADFLRYVLPFEYNPKATAPLFDKFLNRVLPDKDCQLILSEFIGWLFITGFKQEKALILYGTGANGKSVCFEIISALLGAENVSNYTMSNLCEENGYYRAMLVNKLLNYSSEIGGNRTNPDTIKQLISGEPLSCRLPYGEPFILESGYAKLMFNANTLPKDTEQTNAYFRRFLIIPFTQTIPEAEQDKNLAQRIIDSELSGIFNWVLAGLDRLLKNQKFTNSEVVNETLKSYRLQSDTVQMFLSDENYVKSETTNTQQKELFTLYRSYCYENGYKSVGNKTFGERCRAIGYNIDRGSFGMRIWAEKGRYTEGDACPY